MAMSIYDDPRSKYRKSLEKELAKGDKAFGGLESLLGGAVSGITAIPDLGSQALAWMLRKFGTELTPLQYGQIINDALGLDYDPKSELGLLGTALGPGAAFGAARGARAGAGGVRQMIGKDTSLELGGLLGSEVGAEAGRAIGGDTGELLGGAVGGILTGAGAAKGGDVGLGIVKPVSKERADLSARLKQFPRDEQYLGVPQEARDFFEETFTSKTGIAPGETIPVRHYSTQPALDVLRGEAYGTNWPGEEARRLSEVSGEPVRNRVMFYTGGTPPEGGVGRNLYEFNLPGIYDISRDPEGIIAQTKEMLMREATGRQIDPNVLSPEWRNFYETALRDANYRGMYDPNAGVGLTWEDVDLRPEGLDTLEMRRGLLNDVIDREIPEGLEDLGAHKNVGTAVGTEPVRQKGGAAPGQYKNYPPGIDTPQRLAAWRRGLQQEVQKGAYAAPWYDRSSAALYQLAGGQPRKFIDLATAMGPTSQRTPVPDNFGYGVEAMYQAGAGNPIKTGAFPKKIGPKLEKGLLDPNEMEGARKVTTYRNDFIAPLYNWVPSGSVIDTWEIRGGKYPTDTISEPRADVMERELALAGERLNEKGITGRYGLPWNPYRGQSAHWTTTKGTAEGTSLEQAGEDLLDIAERQAGLMPYETRPGSSWADQYPRMTSGRMGTQEQYFHDVERLLTDDYGRNIIDEMIGLYEMPGRRGQGIWRSEAGTLEKNPNRVDRPVVRSTLAGGIDKTSREMLDASAVAKGIALNQDGASWFGPFVDTESVPKTQRNAIEFKVREMPRDLVVRMNDQLEKIAKDMKGKNTLIPVPTKDGVMVVRIEGGKGMDKVSQRLSEWMQGQKEMHGYQLQSSRRGRVESNYITRGEYKDKLMELSPALREKVLGAVMKVSPLIQRHLQHYESSPLL